MKGRVLTLKHISVALGDTFLHYDEHGHRKCILSEFHIYSPTAIQIQVFLMNYVFSRNLVFSLFPALNMSPQVSEFMSTCMCTTASATLNNTGNSLMQEAGEGMQH